MYDIRQFKPVMYLLILIGIAGFGLAVEAPLPWAGATILVLFHYWLDRTGRFQPAPRLVANLVTLLLFIYTVHEVYFTTHTRWVLVLGQFLVFLQVIKLYELRANRDYAQLLVLSLLLMVAATISTASLMFALLLAVYLFLSLYCCLLFHLKVEAERAKRLIGIRDEDINPATLRQDQRYLPRSMRRLTMLVALVSIVSGVLVFVLWPRNTVAGLFSQLQYRPSEALTGFSDTVSFQNVARMTQNTEVVASVKVSKNGDPVAGTMPLLLRGTTASVYSGNDPNSGASWVWSRKPRTLPEDPADFMAGGGATLSLRENDGSELWRQEVTLEPTGTRVLFALAGPVTFQSDRELKLVYLARDATLQSNGDLYNRFSYTVLSTNNLSNLESDTSPADPRGDTRETVRRATCAHTADKDIDPRIKAMARRPEVSGVKDDGTPLVAARALDAAPSPLDGQIARAIETYLRRNYSYTLDLTSEAALMRDRDPLEAFLTDVKKGHCEYLAGAMTLLCQSLGIETRMVIGFRSNEYNEIGGYYIVRQSDAHAWVEVNLGDRWETFDPTSGSESGSRRGAGVGQQMTHFFNYLQFLWANNVVAYDRESRLNLVSAAERQLGNAASSTAGVAKQARGWLNKPAFINFSSRLLTTLVFVLVLMVVGAVGWFIYERMNLRRRATRMGIDSLPKSERNKLARQLGFYDDLLRLLARHNIVRPPHLTPMEFSDSITYLPNEAYDATRRLTEIFYRIRFGDARLSAGRHRRLVRVVQRIEPVLARGW